MYTVQYTYTDGRQKLKNFVSNIVRDNSFFQIVKNEDPITCKLVSDIFFIHLTKHIILKHNQS